MAFNAPATRWELFRAVFWRSWVKVALLLWGAVGALDLIDGRIAPRLFPATVKAYWDAWYFLPALNWQAWIVAVALILIVATLEGAFRYSQTLATRYNELSGMSADDVVIADPNIQEKTAETVWANRDSEGHILETDEERATDAVLVVLYKNERRTDRAVGPAQGLRAEIVYRNVANQRQVEITDAFWMSERDPSINLRPNATHQAVIAVTRGDETRLYAPKRRIGKLLGRRVKEIEISADLLHVTVSLFDKNHKALKRSELILERLPSGKTEVSSLRGWRNLQVLKLLVDGYRMMVAYREFRREGLDDMHFDWQKRSAAFLENFYPEVRNRFLLEPELSQASRSSFDNRLDAQLRVLDGLVGRSRAIGPG
jgi:hypothetical protein